MSEMNLEQANAVLEERNAQQAREAEADRVRQAARQVANSEREIERIEAERQDSAAVIKILARAEKALSELDAVQRRRVEHNAAQSRSLMGPGTLGMQVGKALTGERNRLADADTRLVSARALLADRLRATSTT